MSVMPVMLTVMLPSAGPLRHVKLGSVAADTGSTGETSKLAKASKHSSAIAAEAPFNTLDRDRDMAAVEIFGGELAFRNRSGLMVRGCAGEGQDRRDARTPSNPNERTDSGESGIYLIFSSALRAQAAEGAGGTVAAAASKAHATAALKAVS